MFQRGPAHFEGEPEPEAKKGLATVLALGTTLGRLGGDPGGLVGQDDGRFHLVTVLTARSRPAVVRSSQAAAKLSGSSAAGCGRRSTWPGVGVGLVDMTESEKQSLTSRLSFASSSALRDRLSTTTTLPSASFRYSRRCAS